MSIGENMRKIRLEKGMTQKQVADSCGLIDSTVRTYERGKANPKPATVAKIAKALGVSAAELYGVDWMPGIETPDQETNSALYQSLLLGQDSVLPIDEPNKARLMVAFGNLNKDGQMEAIKRIEEMSLIPAYQSTTPDSKIVGEKVRRARHEKGLTCQELGEQSGISEMDIRRIELGAIPTEYIKPISNALGVPLQNLLSFTPGEEKELAELAKGREALENFNLDPNSEEYRLADSNRLDKISRIIDVAISRLRPDDY